MLVMALCVPIGLVGGFCLAAGLTGLGGKMGPSTGTVWALCGLVWLLVAVGVFALFWRAYSVAQRRAASEYPLNKAAWDYAIERWHRSYYCHRDDIVFDPETGETSEPGGFMGFLYGTASHQVG